jgi:hypothetical protein
MSSRLKHRLSCASACFLQAKRLLITSDRRSCLGAKRFEQLQMLKFEWQGSMTDYAGWNSGKVEHVNMDDFVELLDADIAENSWDIEGEDSLIQETL